MIVDVGQMTAAHVVKALDPHLRWCRENGIDPPDELLRLLGHLTIVAKSGQPRPTLARPVEVVQDDVMLTLDYDAAARRLDVSSRTVRRLVADGALPAVSILGTRRIRTADLADYVNGLEAA